MNREDDQFIKSGIKKSYSDNKYSMELVFSVHIGEYWYRSSSLFLAGLWTEPVENACLLLSFQLYFEKVVLLAKGKFLGQTQD